MTGTYIMQLFDQYGYLIFFVALGLGPFGIPVPNEIIVMTSGLLAGKDIWNPWIIFGCLLLGIATAVTISYCIGKYFGSRIISKLKNDSKYTGYATAAERLIQQYGGVAIFFGCFVPLIRYFIPLFAGASNYRYRKFATISYLGVYGSSQAAMVGICHPDCHVYSSSIRR